MLTTMLSSAERPSLSRVAAQYKSYVSMCTLVVHGHIVHSPGSAPRSRRTLSTVSLSTIAAMWSAVLPLASRMSRRMRCTAHGQHYTRHGMHISCSSFSSLAFFSLHLLTETEERYRERGDAHRRRVMHKSRPVVRSKAESWAAPSRSCVALLDPVKMTLCLTSSTRTREALSACTRRSHLPANVHQHDISIMTQRHDSA